MDRRGATLIYVYTKHTQNRLLPTEQRPTLVFFVVGGISPLELRECAAVVRDARARRRRTGLGPKVSGGCVYLLWGCGAGWLRGCVG